MDPNSYLPGIDVSHFQGHVDWTRVAAAGQRFAFLKATDGTKFKDPQYQRNVEVARAAGLPVGAYHFFRPSIKADMQAQLFLDYAAPQPGDLPPVLDIEIAEAVPAEALAASIQSWLEIVEQATGAKPIIYTNASFWTTSIRAESDGYLLWIAHYTRHAQPNIPTQWSDWNFWQYSQSGSVDGVPGNVDMNRFAGSEDDLQSLLLK